MPGKVLTNNLEIISKQKNSYAIDNYDELKPSEVKELIQICQKKIDEYINKRGKKIWEHRKKSSGIISGSGFAHAKIIGFFAIFFTISLVRIFFLDNPKNTSAPSIASSSVLTFVSMA